MSYQATLPGITPRPRDTPYGAMVLELRARFGFCWALRNAHWIQHGEDLARATVRVRPQVEGRREAA